LIEARDHLKIFFVKKFTNWKKMIKKNFYRLRKLKISSVHPHLSRISSTMYTFPICYPHLDSIAYKKMNSIKMKRENTFILCITIYYGRSCLSRGKCKSIHDVNLPSFSSSLWHISRSLSRRSLHYKIKTEHVS
jgi:hypothetical protein